VTFLLQRRLGPGETFVPFSSGCKSNNPYGGKSPAPDIQARETQIGFRFQQQYLEVALVAALRGLENLPVADSALNLFVKQPAASGLWWTQEALALCAA
jgi:hypothetical protein